MNGHDSAPQGPGVPALAGSRGRLLREPGGDIPVTVVSQDGATLMLEFTAGAEAITFPAFEELVLECTSNRGMVRLAGEASPGTAQKVAFRVHDVIEVEQRRGFVRIRAPRPVRILNEASGEIVHSFALDLSGTGMLLAGPDKLEPGEQIRFRLRLDAESEPIEGLGRVVRVEQSGRPAVTFDSISEHDRDRLVHFIFDRERSARYKGLGAPTNGEVVPVDGNARPEQGTPS
jgi:hypothetical protein